MTDQEIADGVRCVLIELARLPVEVATLRDSDDLYAAGLTSHASVALMLALEDRFDVEIPDDLLSRATFQSIASMTAAVSGLLDPVAR